MTLVYNITINQGETTSLVFPVVDVNGQPVTVTGWTAKAQVRETEISPVLYEWSTTFNNVTVAGTSVTLTVPGTSSASWPWTHGLYDVKLTDSAGKTYRLAEGVITVDPQITQP